MNKNWKLGDIFKIEAARGVSVYRMIYEKDGELMIYVSEANKSPSCSTFGWNTISDVQRFYTYQFNVEFVCNIYDIGISMNNVVSEPPAVKPAVTPLGHYTVMAEWHEPILNRKKKQVGFIVGYFRTWITAQGDRKITPRVGWSLCHPKDTFDSKRGIVLAKQMRAAIHKVPISIATQYARMLNKMTRRANRLNKITLDS